uniref:uncharacterized protein LOC122590976 isoform X2 n=1 Tax=Erigeron canadensis TaxID=72917 RepID=UPI001CB8EFEF|nr:uncharacterized protein LOC122590976 isoform X2 [Erigeron canadensis]XP_043619089.1 uncharacterized protein LOC122590976 isoform X2 [Erigeron canadensis]
MEKIHHETSSKVSPQVGEDFISSMPEDVIANIIDRLPLQDAFLPNDVAKNPVFTTYPFLKALDLMKLYIGNNSMSSRDFGVLFDRVNLQTFKIKAIYKEAGREPDTVVDCDLIEEMELQSKLLTNIKGNIENEECFVKSILERSPFLNTITMDPHSFRFFNAGDVKIWFANKLFRFPRASPAAVIALRPLK